MTTLETLQKRYAPMLKSGEVVGLKQIKAEKMEVEPGGDIVAVANTASLDLANEVVLPSGADTAYFGTMKTIYWNHNYGLPIGTMRSMKLRPDNKWYVRFALSKTEAKTEYRQDIRTLIAEGIVGGVSIGFAATAWGPATDEEKALYGDAQNVIRKWRWLELSLTPMPCNPDAILQAAKDGKITEDTARRLIKWTAPKRVIRWTAA